ncbi:MAG: DUF58 domain-containing protein [Oscillospiraceae bacterium]|nr:DUF58 domain-containing protein [Oscillospiraceae bacterium]
MSIVNFVATLLVLYLLWGLTLKRSIKSLSCSRTLSCEAAFEGEEGELVEVVRNDRPYVIPWLRIESDFSPNIQLGKQENLHVGDRRYYCSSFTLMPYQQIRRRHRVKFLRRGSYDLGNATLTVGDLLDVKQYWRKQRTNTKVLVYPHLLDKEDLPFPVSLVLGELVRRQQLLTDPFLIRGIRAYQPGDPIRDIHWPATARSGEVQVRVHDHSARAKLLVVLNGQKEDGQWGNVILKEHEAPVEEGIRLAASICVHALRSGLPAGFAANLPLDDEKSSTVLLPVEGTAREEELLAAFARLNLRCTEKFLVFLDSLMNHTGLDILLISQYDSDGIQEGIQKLRQKGNQVTLYVQEGGNQ